MVIEGQLEVLEDAKMIEKSLQINPKKRLEEMLKHATLNRDMPFKY